MQKFIDDLFNIMSERFDGTITRKMISKPNVGETTGFVLRKEGSNCAPTVYVESYYDSYASGYATVEEIADEILKLIDENPEPDTDVDFDQLTNWEFVKDKIRPVLISTVGNEEYIKNLAYSKTQTDLVILYQIELVNDGNACQSIKIQKPALKMYGVTVTELKKAAFKNLDEHIRFMNMAQEIGMLMGAAEEDDDMIEFPMWVLSNDAKTYGAAAIFSSKAMKEVTTRMKTDKLYILPSSIHEVIIMDATKPDVAGKTEELKAMVREVNATQVAPKDKLSDNVYFYNGKTIETVE